MHGLCSQTLQLLGEPHTFVNERSEGAPNRKPEVTHSETSSQSTSMAIHVHKLEKTCKNTHLIVSD